MKALLVVLLALVAAAPCLASKHKFEVHEKVRPPLLPAFPCPALPRLNQPTLAWRLPAHDAGHPVGQQG